MKNLWMEVEFCDTNDREQRVGEVRKKYKH